MGQNDEALSCRVGPWSIHITLASVLPLWRQPEPCLNVYTLRVADTDRKIMVPLAVPA